jgi:hypothetical protein
MSTAVERVAAAEVNRLMSELASHLKEGHWAKVQDAAELIRDVAVLSQQLSQRDFVATNARRLGISTADLIGDGHACGEDCTHPSHRVGGLKPAGWLP